MAGSSLNLLGRRCDVRLVVDVGNTETSYGVFSKGELLYHWRFDTQVSRTSEEFLSLLAPLFAHYGLQQMKWEKVILCSVVPSINRAILEFSRQYLKTELFTIHSGLPFKFAINTDFPREVGADRLANAMYAIEFLPLPSIVVDLGTATTFDVISQKKVYEGGLILPGVRMAVQALSQNTAKLPSVELEFPPKVLGKSTVACIQAGVLYGYTDLIDGLITRLSDELGVSLNVALTGGFCSLFAKRLKHPAEVLPNLTLLGAHLIYERCL